MIEGGVAAMTATVYIVEDDPIVRNSLSELISLGGYHIEAYASAEAFLEDFRPPTGLACILCDVRMPGTDGLELLKILKQDGIQIPFILMTGCADVKTAVEAMKMGAADFIEKPFDSQQLFKQINLNLQLYADVYSRQKQQEDAKQKIARLTRRERQVMELLAGGNQNRIIAEKLDISPRTVEIHRARVMEKLEASSVSEITRIAIRASEQHESSPG